jgi:hypothetical protein
MKYAKSATKTAKIPPFRNVAVLAVFNRNIVVALCLGFVVSFSLSYLMFGDSFVVRLKACTPQSVTVGVPFYETYRTDI